MDVLIVDGYNVIGASSELSRLKLKDIGQARSHLINMLIEYKVFTGYRVIVVFDALYVRGGKEHKMARSGVEIIYTREDETADECIERLIKSVKNVKNKVYVATSDYMEQRTVFSRGALRISARELMLEFDNMEVDIKAEVSKRNNNKPQSRIQMDKHVREQLEALRRGTYKED